MKHTKGNWEVATINCGLDNDEIVTEVNGCTVNICEVFGAAEYIEGTIDGKNESHYEVSKEEAAANAALIAEAGAVANETGLTPRQIKDQRDELSEEIARLNALVAMQAEALKLTREELRACQAVIHLDGGFDPLYVSSAQAAMKVADKALSATPETVSAWQDKRDNEIRAKVLEEVKELQRQVKFWMNSAEEWKAAYTRMNMENSKLRSNGEVKDETHD